MTAEEHEAMLTAATGKESITEAIAWIAQGHDLVPGADVHAVLRSLVTLSPGGEASQEATQRLTRMAAASELDFSFKAAIRGDLVRVAETSTFTLDQAS